MQYAVSGKRKQNQRRKDHRNLALLKRFLAISAGSFLPVLLVNLPQINNLNRYKTENF